MKENCNFPETVEYKSCTATIYQQKNRSNIRFEVRYYDVNGSMQRSSFATYPSAKDFADTAVKEISSHREKFVTLRGRNAFDYQTALEKLDPLEVSIVQAATLIAEANKQLSGKGTLSEAIKYFIENRPRQSPDITVRQVVDQMLSLKEREGEVGQIYLRDLRVRLYKFAEAFQCPISRVSAAEIRDYLLERNVSNRTRHNLRTTLVTLFNFSKAEGYLPADHKGVPRPTKRSRMKLAIKIFTPEEMTRLLASAQGDQLAALCLQGFAGLRAEEMKRLEWSNIDLKEKHIIVPDTVAKCEERRIVPISDNLAAWLQPLLKTSGPVCPFSNLAIVYSHLARRAGVAWKRNGLRHSFISYRTALTKNVPLVAFEAGNSPAVIYRNYLKCVTESVATKWFEIMPDQPSNIIPVAAAEIDQKFNVQVA
jgi:integrase